MTKLKLKTLAFLCMTLLSATNLNAKRLYGFNICGTEVTNENCTDLTTIKGVVGKASYDQTKSVLKLENTTITADKNCISVWGTDKLIKIELIGNNKLNSKNGNGIKVFDGVEIVDNGSLTIESPETEEAISLESKSSLTIVDCNLNVKGGWGIVGTTENILQNKGILTIQNANVTAEGTKYAIGDLKEFTLNDCKIYEPKDAKFNKTHYGIAVNDELCSNYSAIGNKK